LCVPTQVGDITETQTVTLSNTGTTTLRSSVRITLHDVKIKFTNVSHFSEQKNTLPNHHVYHAIHHVLTSKKPHLKRRFP